MNNNHERINLTFQINAAKVRKEKFEGRPHLVVPMVMINEGVLNGMLYPAEELSKFVEAWNGRPIPIRHPEDCGTPISANSPEVIEKNSVGYLFNTKFEDNKLKAEAWFDEAKLSSVPGGTELRRRIETNQPTEISTGLFLERDPVEGTFKGKRYSAIARNHRPGS